MNAALKVGLAVLVAVVASLGTNAFRSSERARVVVDPLSRVVAPFACGQSWQATASTRSSESSHGLIFNRVGTVGVQDEGEPVLSPVAGTVGEINVGDDSTGPLDSIAITFDRDTIVISNLASGSIPEMLEQGDKVQVGAMLGLVGGRFTAASTYVHLAYFRDDEAIDIAIDDGIVQPGDVIRSKNCGAVDHRSGRRTHGLIDFDGDGVKDTFTTRDGSWYVSYGDSGEWTATRSSEVGHNDVGYGDFDGDGLTDIFHATGTTWRYSPAGLGDWINLSKSGLTLDQLALGEFDGDGRTDVFRAQNGRWSASSGGRSAWQLLAASSVPISDLALGDFNGDGLTDVLRSTGKLWQISYEARRAWTTIAASSATLDTMAINDFDGDGRTDVFAPSAGVRGAS